jgi:hypothetical protein
MANLHSDSDALSPSHRARKPRFISGERGTARRYKPSAGAATGALSRRPGDQKPVMPPSISRTRPVK